jgi:hypothetical protein
MRTTLLLSAFATLAAGCAEDPGPRAAQGAVASFQQALHDRDEAACRQLLTRDSAAALADMPWDRVASQQPLQVLAARREQNAIFVQVADPNAGGRVSDFVVVREYGRMVIDLVATAGLHAEVREATGARDVVEPRELTPADHDRIRAYELAQPPR